MGGEAPRDEAEKDKASAADALLTIENVAQPAVGDGIDEAAEQDFFYKGCDEDAEEGEQLRGAGLQEELFDRQLRRDRQDLLQESGGDGESNASSGERHPEQALWPVPTQGRPKRQLTGTREEIENEQHDEIGGTHGGDGDPDAGVARDLGDGLGLGDMKKGDRDRGEEDDTEK